MGAGAYGSAIVAPGSMSGEPAEFRALAQAATESERVYRGFVVRAEPQSDGVHIELDNGVVLEERTIGHLSTAGISDRELAWTVGRLAGLTPEQLDIQGLAGELDEIVVWMPVDHVSLDRDVEIGPVVLTTDAQPIADAMQPLRDSAEKTRFAAAGAWALVTVEASMLYPAEQAAVREIDAALDVVTLEGQYSLACDPDGVPIAFERSSILMDPALRSDVLVVGGRTGRVWLRSLVSPPVRPVLRERRLMLDDDILGSQPRLRDAIHAWRRAVRATDPIEAAGALFEAVEFHVAGTSSPPLLSKQELAAVMRAVELVPLEAEKAKRVRDMVGRSNETPLLVRLRQRLESDRVPFNDEELGCVKRVRDARNRALHGKEMQSPDADDLEVARALVNRMLFHRVWRASKPGANREERS